MPLIQSTQTIANPTSAFLRAGPSLVPSPVTATTSLLPSSLQSMIPFTKVHLSCGEDLASTFRRGHNLSMSSCFTFVFLCLCGKVKIKQHEATYNAFISDPSVELFAFENQRVFVSGLQDATFESNGTRGVDVVSGHHSYSHSSPLTLFYSFWYL